MYSTLGQASRSRKPQALVEFLMFHPGSLSLPFDPMGIPELHGIADMDAEFPEIDPLGTLIALSDSDQYGDNDRHLIIGLMIAKLQKDEDALNWCCHHVMCQHHIAGNDANLFELLGTLDPQHKIALMAGYFSFWGLAGVEGTYKPLLHDALVAVHRFCRQQHCETISWLPTNENLLQADPDQTIASAGRVGFSSIILEACPLSTLPLSLLVRYEKFLMTSEKYKLSEMMEKSPLASGLWLRLLYRMGDFFCKKISEVPSVSILNFLALEASGGTVDWSTMGNHQWNSHYPSAITDSVDLSVMHSLLGLKDKISESEFSDLRDALTIAYHTSSIESGYTSGTVWDKIEDEYLTDVNPVPGVGKIMFPGGEADPMQVVVDYFDKHEHMVSSSLVARALSQMYSAPKAGIDLLQIINHYDPDQQTDVYAYAMTRIMLSVSKLCDEEFTEYSDADLPGEVYGMLTKISTEITKPWPSSEAMERVYAQMPDCLKSPEGRLTLGLPIDQQAMQSGSDKLRSRAFAADLGL